MKILRFLGALALAACVLFPSTTIAVSAAPTVATDSSGILGTYPGFQSGYFADQFGNVFKTITDSTPSTPSAVGKIVYWQGGTWIQAATANVALGRNMYGVVIVAAAAQGGSAIIQTQGFVSASVKTGGSVACAITGDIPLAITTTGDLTPTVAATVPGVTWGTCASVLAISQSATLINIVIGGY